MTGKDVLKMLLCLHGYDRNVKVESYRGEGNTVGNEGHYFRTADEYEKLLDEYPNDLENDFLKEKNYAALYFASKCRGWHDYCEKCLEGNKCFGHA